MLSIRGLNVSIRNVQILRGVSLELPQGSMTGLIGRNGAGKTTFMKSLMGLLKVDSGAVRFEGADLVPLATHERARRRRRGATAESLCPRPRGAGLRAAQGLAAFRRTAEAGRARPRARQRHE